MAFRQGLTQSSLGDGSKHRNGACRRDGLAQDLLMPSAVHIVQNYTANVDRRIERLAAEYKSGCCAGHLGGVHYENHRRLQMLAKRRRRVGAHGVETIKQAAGAFDDVDPSLRRIAKE